MTGIRGYNLAGMTAWAVLASVGWGCRSVSPSAKIQTSVLPCDAPTAMAAMPSATPVVVDGRLDEPVWRVAPPYALRPSADRARAGESLREEGTVRFAWDTENLYLAVEFADSDVVAEGTEDGEHHYLKGDLAELFLWPDQQTWYWELYGTPHGKQSSFFFPSPGRMLPSCTTGAHLPLRVAAEVQGTLNDWSDRDHGWTAEMAIPVRELTRRGETWGPESSWRVMVGRYNYSVHLPKLELSSVPRLSRASFHLRDEYARLRLVAEGKDEGEGLP